MATPAPPSTDSQGTLAPTGTDFDRPLLLTPGEDIVGYITGKLGQALLFLVAALSVIAVLLIFVFIIQRNELFLTTTGGDYTRSQYSTAATQAIQAYEETLERTGEKARAASAKQAFLERIHQQATLEDKAELAYDALTDVAESEYDIALRAVGAPIFADERQEYYSQQARRELEDFRKAPADLRQGQARQIIQLAAERVAHEALYRTGNLDKAQAAADELIQRKANKIYQDVLEDPGEEIGDPQQAAALAKKDFLAALRPTLATEVSDVSRRVEESLGSTDWYPQAERSEFGMLPLIYGSFLVTFGSLIIAVPLGITAAVVLSDIVPFKIRQFIKPVVELLAAIPSVAYGFFAIMVVAPWLQTRFDLQTGTNALNASVILAVMAIPTIVSVAEDALTAMGRDLREASYAMGATRFETLFKVVIPAAHNGIIAAVILGMMRAIGETMVVWMAAGNAAHIPHAWYDLSAVFGNLAQAVRTMTATIAAEMAEAPEGSIHRSALFSVGLLLLIFTFTLNMITEYFVSRFKKGMGQSHKKAGRQTGMLRAGLTAAVAGLRWLLATVVWAAILMLVIWIASAILGVLTGLGGGMGWTWQVVVFFALVGYRLVMYLAELFAEEPVTGVKSAISAWFGRLIDPVRMRVRLGADKAFTGFAYGTVLLVMLSLVVLLVPIFSRGIGAVVFRETVEHRLFLLEFNGIQRGNKQQIEQQFQACQDARKPVYQLLDRYAWLNPEAFIDEASERDRTTGKQLQGLADSITTQISRLGERIGKARRDGRDQDAKALQAELDDARKRLDETQKRNKQADRASGRLKRWLCKAYEALDRPEAEKYLKRVLEFKDKDLLKDTASYEFFAMAERYRQNIAGANLALRQEYTTLDSSQTYSQAYTDVREIIIGKSGTACLLGREDRSPDNVNHLPPEVRYGASRWSMVEEANRKLQKVNVWVTRRDAEGNFLDRTKSVKPREELFDKPSLAGFRKLFAYVNDHLDPMFVPQWTFYWGYFTDPSTPGHFLGGVGPEIVGTLLVTLISVMVALPLGVIAAAYLVEVAGDNLLTRAIRMCINTLAGVPSIVFGLFGMAFFLGWFLPTLLGSEEVWGKSTILAGGLTLAILILPIIIRASEEAIRSVPVMYKEASLGLGAGKLRCFLTVQLPAALPGVLTGTILGMSRAAGETAPLLFTAAVATASGGGFVSFEGWKFWQAFEQGSPILSYTAYDIAVGDRVANMVPHNQYGTVMTLVLLVLLLNFAAILLRSRVSKKLRGG